jgi:hypothetical protein
MDFSLTRDIEKRRSLSSRPRIDLPDASLVPSGDLAYQSTASLAGISLKQTGFDM